MTSEQEKRICQMTRDGLSQRQIIQRTGLSRSSIHRAQKLLGVSLDRHGPRCPEIKPEQISLTLEMLRAGMGTKRIARELGLREHAVRRISEESHFHHTSGPGRRRKLTAGEWLKLACEILAHNDHARTLARKYAVPYKAVLRMAKELLGVPHLRCGRGEPLASDLPMRPRTFPSLAEFLVGRLFDGAIPAGATAKTICDAAMSAVPALREAPPEARKAFAENLLPALQSQIAIRSVPASAWLN